VNNDCNLTLSSVLEHILTTMPALQKPVISLNNSTGKECVLARCPEVIEQRRRQQAQVRSAERPTNYLPFPRDPLFQPRPGEFERLETLLAASEASQPVHAGLVGVTGLGGVGKTQLAVEFAYRYQQCFPDGIFWMPANGTTQADWQHCLAELAFHSDYLPPDDDRASPENEARRARHLCRYLASHANALFILDNVERPDLLLSTLPALAGGHFACSILYTSRNTQTPSGVVAHPVEQLLEEAALRLLLTTARPVLLSEALAGSQSPEACAVRAVCALVGHLPLACVHLRSLLEQDRQVSLSRLAAVLKQQEVLDAVTVTFRLSWQRVQTEEARRLFLLACTFPEANPIPRWLLGLAAGLGEQDDIFAPLGKARLHLRDLSLLEDLSSEQVRLHPLVRAFGLRMLKKSEAEGSMLCEEAAQRLASVCTDLSWLEQRVRKKGYWTCLEQIRAMLEAVERLDSAECVERIRQVERCLDRESYLLATQQWWSEKLPGLFYQQLYNRALEAGHPFPPAPAPRYWLKQTAQTGVEEHHLLRIFAGHADSVSSVAFSPNGKQILTGSKDKTARLWETNSGRELLRLEGHTSRISSVAFSPDGTQILTGSEDKTARLWDTVSGRQLLCLEGHTSSVYGVAFSPDGTQLLTGSEDKTARLWETSTGRELLRLEGPTDSVNSVAFSPDSTQLLTVSHDRTARLWEASSGHELRRLEGHSASVNSVAFSPDGKQILTGSTDGTARLWETSSGRQLLQLEDHMSQVYSVAFSPDGTYILTGSVDKIARLWETSSGHLLLRLEGHTSLVGSVAFSPDGTYILTGSNDKTARVWNTSSGRELLRLEGHTSSLNSVAFSPDGCLIVTCDVYGRVHFWRPQEAGHLLGIYLARDAVEALYWQDATHVILANRGGARGYPRLYRLELVGM
jgi:WD40 repeat protein